VKPYQVIGWSMAQTSAITAVVGTNIWHGLRPKTSALPAINYYELPGVRRYGMETQPYSIQCRAATAGTARDLARLIVDLFSGTSGTGIQGVQSTFTIARGSLRADQGLIPEEDAYNAPVDIQIVYSVDAVS
jgi:hypothetical protein